MPQAPDTSAQPWQAQFPQIGQDPQARTVSIQDCYGEDRAAGAPAAIEAALSAVLDRIDITLPDGRSVSVELQQGAIRVHAYNRSCDAPLSLTIPETGEITVQDESYVTEPKWTDEELAADEAGGPTP